MFMKCCICVLLPMFMHVFEMMHMCFVSNIHACIWSDAHGLYYQYSFMYMRWRIQFLLPIFMHVFEMMHMCCVTSGTAAAPQSTAFSATDCGSAAAALLLRWRPGRASTYVPPLLPLPLPPFFLTKSLWFYFTNKDLEPDAGVKTCLLRETKRACSFFFLHPLLTKSTYLLPSQTKKGHQTRSPSLLLPVCLPIWLPDFFPLSMTFSCQLVACPHLSGWFYLSF